MEGKPKKRKFRRSREQRKAEKTLPPEERKPASRARLEEIRAAIIDKQTQPQLLRGLSELRNLWEKEQRAEIHASAVVRYGTVCQLDPKVFAEYGGLWVNKRWLNDHLHRAPRRRAVPDALFEVKGTPSSRSSLGVRQRAMAGILEPTEELREKFEELKDGNQRLRIEVDHVAEQLKGGRQLNSSHKLANPDRFPVLTVPETAELFRGVSRSTIYRWLEEGKLDRAGLGKKAGKRGRCLITTDSVARLLQKSDE